MPKDDGTYRDVKYEQCGGARLSAYVPKRIAPMIADMTIPIRIVEGDKKELALAGRGLCAISLSGVDCWKVQAQPKDKAPSEPIPDQDDIAWRGRIALIEYDSDTLSKPEVQSSAAAPRRRVARARGGRGGRRHPAA